MDILFTSGFSAGAVYRTSMLPEANVFASAARGASAHDAPQYGDPNSNIRVRKDFSETWIFDNIEK